MEYRFYQILICVTTRQTDDSSLSKFSEEIIQLVSVCNVDVLQYAYDLKHIFKISSSAVGVKQYILRHIKSRIYIRIFCVYYHSNMSTVLLQTVITYDLRICVKYLIRYQKS